jgi:hypothetical protein
MVEYQLITTQYNKLEGVVTVSALSALAAVDPVQLAYGSPEIDPVQARAIFDSCFSASIQPDLDAFLQPPTVEEFRVYNTPELPATCSRNVHLVRPSIHVVVRAVLKRPALRFLGDTLTIRVHKDVDNHLEM